MADGPAQQPSLMPEAGCVLAGPRPVAALLLLLLPLLLLRPLLLLLLAPLLLLREALALQQLLL